MTIMMDPPVRCGSAVIAAISRISVSHHGLTPCAVFMAEKTPVAILVRVEGAVLALAPDGTPLTHGAVEKLCPGAIRQMTNFDP